MQDGFYRVDFEGRADAGAGAFALVGGKVGGLDIAGVTYTGSYSREGDELVGSLKASAPPGTSLVTGANAGPAGLNFPVTLRVRSNGMAEVQTPTGPVKARLTLVTQF